MICFFLKFNIMILDPRQIRDVIMYPKNNPFNPPNPSIFQTRVKSDRTGTRIEAGNPSFGSQTLTISHKSHPYRAYLAEKTRLLKNKIKKFIY